MRMRVTWGNQDEGHPDENACHVLFRKCVPRVIRGRGPYNAPLFNLPTLPEQNGRVKK